MKFRENDYIETPHGNSTVWRYMNDWKLNNLLTSSSLYFPNAIKLTDQYEVTLPQSVLAQKRVELQKSGLSGRDLDEEMALFDWSTNPMKNLVLINCWSINQHESYALWKIYLGGDTDGVAIKSTISKLKRSVILGGDTYPEEFFIGKVRYKRHLNYSELARTSIITTKKPFYDFEKEVRLFILNCPQSEGGTKPPYDIRVGREVKVNLHELIHEIYISPFASDNYRNKVRQLVQNSSLKNIKVVESEIRDS
ncbi:hypothetical protein ACVSUJ_08510 [Yersinia enterocolitica]